MDEVQVIQSLAALAHPIRLKVFRALVVAGPAGMTPGVMHEGLGIPATTLSFHLKELAGAELISVERASRNLVYRAAFDRIDGSLDVVFAPWLPADRLDSYVAGLILLAAAPCTAMVFVWSQLCKGDPLFTLSQVALNDSIMVVAFAPLVALLLGLSSVTVPWNTLITSVVIDVVAPVLLSQMWRRALLKRGAGRLQAVASRLGPWSIGALLAALVLLFAFQREVIVDQPWIIAMLAVPILIQVVFNAGLAYLLNRQLRVPHCVAGPSALIGASNFFELAVATAIALFGFRSGAALATMVGVLIEVPLMLAVVRIVNRSRGWYERRVILPTP